MTLSPPRLAMAVLGLAMVPMASRSSDGEPACWPQFRGPEARGVAPDGVKFPLRFSPTSNVQWKTAVPDGMSSPCVWGEHIFLTAFNDDAHGLETLCLDRRNGHVIWRRSAPVKKLEGVHKLSSRATATPTTDGERVIVYFGSYGLLCYDLAGKELWHKELPTPATRFGSGTSPVLGSGLLLFKCQGFRSSLLALDPRTGATVWQHEKLPFDAGYSVPLVHRGEGPPEVIIHGEQGIRAYGLKDGKERWAINRLFGEAIPSPVAAEGMLFFVSQFAGGDQDDRLQVPSYDELLKKYDKDKDGKLSRDEVKDFVLYSRDGITRDADIPLTSLFDIIDRNKDGRIDRQEWMMIALFAPMLDNALLAVRPGGHGDVTRSHVAWKEKKSLPEISSPLCYRGRLYLVKHGGIVSCLEAKTGKLLYRERLGPTGLYYASPVAGDGKVYFASTRGVVVVVEAGDRFKVLARNDVGEPVQATPALVDGTIYLRAGRHLYAFRE
jgi:outer membrane protein assembly factor BamB